MPNKDTEKELSWEDHLAETIKAFRKEMKAWHGEMLPAEFHTHRRNAQKEMLLAFRALIDARIEDIEKAEKDKVAPRATKIKVE